MLSIGAAELASALTDKGFDVADQDEGFLSLKLGEIGIEVEVVPVAYATAARIDELIEDSPKLRRLPVVVADRITVDARGRLRAAGWGWLDRRGHLHLRSPGILIDTEVEPSQRDQDVPDEPLRGRAGLAIAYRLLTTNRADPISPTRSSLTFAPSTISEALSRLRDAGLVDRAGAPLLPELFWVLADHWKPKRIWLASEPPVDEAAWHGADTPGWCLSGTAAAVDWGAPVVSTGATPDLYVPGPVAVNIAARRYGIAHDAQVAAASVAVAPVADVTSFRQPPRSGLWPLAHPVTVALDLAQDRARGREILEDWSLLDRVW